MKDFCENLFLSVIFWHKKNGLGRVAGRVRVGIRFDLEMDIHSLYNENT